MRLKFLSFIFIFIICSTFIYAVNIGTNAGKGVIINQPTEQTNTTNIYQNITNNYGSNGTYNATYERWAYNQTINFNPFNQDLNTTSNVTFDYLQTTGNIGIYGNISNYVYGYSYDTLMTITQGMDWATGGYDNYALVVNGYTLLGGIRLNGVDGANALYSPVGQLGFTADAGNPITFSHWTSPTNSYRIYIDGDGLVGINTDTPTEILDVNGNLRVNGNINITGCLEYNQGGVRTLLGTCV